MLQIVATTKASGREYEVTANQFESMDEAREYWEGLGENADEVNLGIVNAAMLQNAKQGNKGDVRSALAKFDEDSPEVDAAILAHQEAAVKYVIGKPRGGRLADGSTKTELKERVSSVAAASPEALAEINRILAEYADK
jgi:hypothetical protein